MKIKGNRRASPVRRRHLIFIDHSYERRPRSVTSSSLRAHRRPNNILLVRMILIINVVVPDKLRRNFLLILLVFFFASNDRIKFPALHSLFQPPILNTHHRSLHLPFVHPVLLLQRRRAPRTERALPDIFLLFLLAFLEIENASAIEDQIVHDRSTVDLFHFRVSVDRQWCFFFFSFFANLFVQREHLRVCEIKNVSRSQNKHFKIHGRREKFVRLNSNHMRSLCLITNSFLRTLSR